MARNRTNSRNRTRVNFRNRHFTTVAAVVVLGVALLGYHLLNQSYAAIGHMCEINGGDYCVGSDSITISANVGERYTGRDIVFLSDGHFAEGYDTGHLAFGADTNKCLQAGGDGAGINVGSCSGDGIRWERRPNPSARYQIRFKNVRNGQYLAGHNCGCQFHTEPLGWNGWFYQFVGPSI